MIGSYIVAVLFSQTRHARWLAEPVPEERLDSAKLLRRDET
jgi:hypothetical protein